MIFVLNLWLMIQRIVRHRWTSLPSWYDIAEFLMLKMVVRTVTTVFSRAEEFLMFDFWKWCHVHSQVKEIKLSVASYWVVPLRLASLALRGNYVLSGILVSAESHRNVMLPSEWIGAHRTTRATTRKQTPPHPAVFCSLKTCSGAFYTEVHVNLFRTWKVAWRLLILSDIDINSRYI